MGQLIKLADYISRYEMDMYRYPSRFVRLKQERWNKVRRDWEAFQVEKKSSLSNKLFNYSKFDEPLKKDSFIKRSFKKILKQEQKEERNPSSPSEENSETISPLLLKRSLEDLKEGYLEELLAFQLNWASSTISEVSNVNPVYKRDKNLRYLLRYLPDSFLILYKPVILAKKAPVDMEIIIITPAEIWLLVMISGSEDTIYSGSADRFWEKRTGQEEERILNPGISIQRMKVVIESLFEDHPNSFPIRTAILAKDSYIDMRAQNNKIKIMDKREANRFFSKWSKNRMPLKNEQLKITDHLLSHCLTTSFSRTGEAEEETENTFDS